MHLYIHTAPPLPPQRVSCSTFISTPLSLRTHYSLFMCHYINIYWMLGVIQVVNEKITPPRSHIASGIGGTRTSFSQG